MWKRVTVLVVAVCCLAQVARAQEDFGADAGWVDQVLIGP